MPPAKRRQYGTGSISRRADGLWIGRIEAGWTASGTRRRLTVSAKTQAACRDKLNAKVKELALSDGASGSTQLTVKAWADDWLPRHAREVRPRSYATDASAVRKWIVPTLGRRRLADLTAADVRKIRTEIVDAKNSTTTAHRAHRVLIKMLRDAVVEGHKVPAAALATKAPGLAVPDRTAIPIEHTLAMLEAASKRPDGVRWLVGALYGPRQGEILGLTRDCVDLDAGLIDISWQLQPLPYIDPADKSLGFRVPDGYEAQHLHRAFHLVRPKTRKGRRVLPIVSVLREPLRHWMDVMPANPWGLLWTSVDSRYGRDQIIPIRAEQDREEWQELHRLAGIGKPNGRYYTTHERRHGAVTLLLDSGVDPEVVKAIVGHSSIIATMIYRHVETAAMSQAVERMARQIAPTAAQPIAHSAVSPSSD